MRTYILRLYLSATALLLSVFGGGMMYAQTKQYLSAPVVKSEIQLRWNSAAKTMQWAADDDTTFRAVNADTLFLTKTSVFITYPSLNPLSLHASSTATAVDDPGFAAITKLIAALTSLSGVVAPALPANTPLPVLAPAPGATCVNAASDIAKLRQTLYGPASSATEITKATKSWIKSIDDSFANGLSGPSSISAGIAQINVTIGTLPDAAQAKKQWDDLLGCADTAADPQKGYYQAAALSNQLVRIQQLADMKSAMTKLADVLDKQYRDSTKWMGPIHTRFVISSEIIPTFEKMQTVATVVASLTISVDSTTGIVSSDQQNLGTASFSIRKYSPFAPEVGVGAVFGTLTEPTYGTSKNAAGQTTVALTSSKNVSVNPTILANFVCRCGSGPLVPMVQIGVATSKDLPAILLGGGLRLFGLGKGDVAIGGGLMLGWYKDLTNLHIGDVIAGTADINNDLAYIKTPKPAGYFAIQYKF